MKKPTFEFITETATEVGPKWTNKEIAQFHYFNPNGLYAQKRARDRMISDAVAAGTMKSGAILAYGRFNDYNAMTLGQCALSGVVKTRTLQITLQALRREIETVDEQLSLNNCA